MWRKSNANGWKNQTCGAFRATERELSQLAAVGTTGDGWNNLATDRSGDALRIGDNPRSGKTSRTDSSLTAERISLQPTACTE